MKCTGDLPQYAIEQAILLKEKDKYDYSTNEGRADLAENKITNGVYYNEQHKQRFNYENEQDMSPCYIKEKQISMLSDINDVFNKHNTKYRIIICPTIGCDKLNIADLTTMKTIFGEKNVIDLTARDSLSLDYTNFYLDGHIRPKGTRMIMDIAYK